MAQEKLTDENERYIIDWLNDKNDGRPYFLLKFCQEERFAKDICAGNLFANTPKWFRNKENESGVRGQGDAYELILPMRFDKVEICNPQTKDIICELGNGSGQFQIKDDDVKPLVSFVGITINEMHPVRVTEDEACFRFPFSEEEFEPSVTVLPPISTIVCSFLSDGTKTVVNCMDNVEAKKKIVDGKEVIIRKPRKCDTYSKEAGLAMAIVKKWAGNNGNYNNIFRKFIPEMAEEEKAAKKAKKAQKAEK